MWALATYIGVPTLDVHLLSPLLIIHFCPGGFSFFDTTPTASPFQVSSSPPAFFSLWFVSMAHVAYNLSSDTHTHFLECIKREENTKDTTPLPASRVDYDI